MNATPTQPELPEPKRMGATVVDRDGDVWKRGRTMWTCQAPVDGGRVRRVGRLPWSALVRNYGPFQSIDLKTTGTDL